MDIKNCYRILKRRLLASFSIESYCWWI